MSSAVCCFVDERITDKEFKTFVFEMSLLFTMAASILFWEFFASFWTEVYGIRAQSPATNEQPWGKFQNFNNDKNVCCFYNLMKITYEKLCFRKFRCVKLYQFLKLFFD